MIFARQSPHRAAWSAIACLIALSATGCATRSAPPTTSLLAVCEAEKAAILAGIEARPVPEPLRLIGEGETYQSYAEYMIERWAGDVRRLTER